MANRLVPLAPRIGAKVTLGYRHEWTVGDLLTWDICGVMQRVTPYDPDSGRLMHRTTLYGVEGIKGVEPVKAVGRAS